MLGEFDLKTYSYFHLAENVEEQLWKFEDLELL